MKKIIWTVFLVLVSITIKGQRSFDSIFNDYSEKDGYVTVNISGGLLKLVAFLEPNDKDLDILASSVSRIRIIANDKPGDIQNEFYSRFMSEVDMSKYEEFMDITSGSTKAKMLVRAEGDLFTEFLMVVGGDDNAVIQIKGKMSADDIKRLSADIDNGGNSIIKLR